MYHVTLAVFAVTLYARVKDNLISIIFIFHTEADGIENVYS